LLTFSNYFSILLLCLLSGLQLTLHLSLRKEMQLFLQTIVTYSLCKVMESIFKDQIIFYLITGLLSKEQHAFIVKHSTVTNLLECVYDWAFSLHNRVPQDEIYLDFSHAFDCVVHSKLCIKLQSFCFGIDGLLLSWIFAFLSNRIRRVVVEGFSSNWVTVISGVPQSWGSVLGLFSSCYMFTM